MAVNEHHAVKIKKNRRGIEEKIIDLEHLTLRKLSRRFISEDIDHGCLHKRVPPYPRPKLHVTHLSHSTNLSGLKGIKEDGGFRSPYDDDDDDDLKVVWFNLTVTPEDLTEAETRNLKIVHPDSTEDCQPKQGQTVGFLKRFASSPAFSSKSRYGSYRFTFGLKEVLDKYSQQFCAGKKPVMRIWKTVLYKQEVLYAVLVTNQEKFSEFPQLQDSSVVEFREDPPHFVWRPQAMCNVHSFQLVKSQDHTLGVQRAPQECYYVWDQVAIALDVGEKVFRFDDMVLRGGLRYCKKDVPSTEKFQWFYTAQDIVNRLWPLKGFEDSTFAVYP